MQKVMIIGRLARDPETRTTKAGKSICSFSIPVSEKRNEQEHTEWFKVKVFGKAAELCQQYLSKGRNVYVEGKLKTEKFTGQDGQERSVTELLADNVQFLDRAENGAQKPAQPRHSAPSESFGGMDDFAF
jgi:single-strand DNA-binding protein